MAVRLRRQPPSMLSPSRRGLKPMHRRQAPSRGDYPSMLSPSRRGLKRNRLRASAAYRSPSMLSPSRRGLKPIVPQLRHAMFATFNAVPIAKGTETESSCRACQRPVEHPTMLSPSRRGLKRAAEQRDESQSSPSMLSPSRRGLKRTRCRHRATGADYPYNAVPIAKGTETCRSVSRRHRHAVRLQCCPHREGD